MNISEDQIYACETLILLEDQYLTGLNKDESRVKLEPIRKCIAHLKSEYGISDDVRSSYDRYIRLMRANVIYSDLINQLNNDKADKETD